MVDPLFTSLQLRGLGPFFPLVFPAFTAFLPLHVGSLAFHLTMKCLPLWPFCFLLLGLIFGTAFIAIQIAVSFIPPLLLVALRTAISFAVFLPTLTLRACFYPVQSKAAYSKLSWRIVGLGSGLGFFFVVIPFTLTAAGETKVDGGIAAILASIIPIFALLWRVVLWRTCEGITRWHLLGVAVGFVGVIAVCLRSALDPLLHNGTFSLADLNLGADGVLLLAPASYGLAYLYAAHFFEGFDNLYLAMLQSGWGFVLTMAGSLIFEVPPWPWSWAPAPYYQFISHLPLSAILAVLYLGLLSTGCSFLLYFYLINTIGPVRTSFVGFLLPLVATLESILLLGSWRTVTLPYKLLEVGGGILTVAGIMIVQIGNLVSKEETDEDFSSSGSDSGQDASLSKDEGREFEPFSGLSVPEFGPITSFTQSAYSIETDTLLA